MKKNLYPAIKRTLKIRTFLNTNFGYSDTSCSNYTQKFNDLLDTVDENLRELIIIPINERVGLFNWAIDFRENPEIGFRVDIFFADESHFKIIYSIITEKIPQLNFLFFYKGQSNLLAS